MANQMLMMAGNLEKHLDLLGDQCEVHRWYNAENPDALLDEIGDQIRVVGTNGHVGVPVDVMERLPNLEMIGCFGVGYDAIDIEYCRERRIAVTNTPDVLSDAVAELAAEARVNTDTVEYVHLELTVAEASPPAEYTTLQSM